MSKILIVDDEIRIRGLLRKYAEYEGHEIREAYNGVEAVSYCSIEDFDLIILDIMMPDLDGYAALKQIRKVKDVPVIVLSAKGEEMDRLKAFELGADDYVVKPFSPKEILARVNAILRRRVGTGTVLVHEESQPKPHEMYIYKGLTLDYTARKLIVDGVEQKLTLKEYELLNYFVENRGIALTRDQLLTMIWGFDFYGDERTLDTHIKLLRGNLGPYRDLLTTIRGVGYRYEEK